MVAYNALVLIGKDGMHGDTTSMPYHKGQI